MTFGTEGPWDSRIPDEEVYKNYHYFRSDKEREAFRAQLRKDHERRVRRLKRAKFFDGAFDLLSAILPLVFIVFFIVAVMRDQWHIAALLGLSIILRAILEARDAILTAIREKR